MSTVPLPAEPHLDQLRAQARDLQRAVRAGDPAALAEVGERHPGGAPEPGARGGFTLSAAQLVVARRYGFASWPRLRRHLDVVAEYTRVPGAVPAAADPATEFLRLACLVYEDDDPARWAAAARLLADHPEIPASGIHAAAAAADVDAVRAHLAADPGAADRQGGPYGWTPLFHLAYARHDPAVAAEPVLATARALLAAGADQDAGYLWHGLPTPFTVLTGIFGEGEGGPRHQPRHPHSVALARVVLEAGADPNDGQTLYNRMFRPDDDHLDLLFAFGLGTGGDGPWFRRMGPQLQTPAAMLADVLGWAVGHGQPDRVRLLAAHGVDLRSPVPRRGRIPAEVAALAGDGGMVALLVSLGAAPPDLDPVEAFVAAALGGDRGAVDRLAGADPGLVAAVLRARPGLVATAADRGRADAVRLLVELGFAVDGAEERGVTGLHQAAGNGDVAMVELLLALGAGPGARDAAYDATPLGWAEYGDQTAVIEVLAPLTP